MGGTNTTSPILGSDWTPSPLPSCSTLIFSLHVLVITEATPIPASQGFGVLERNGARSNAETPNPSNSWFVWTDECQNVKCSSVLLRLRCGPLGTSVHGLEIMGFNIVDPELGPD